MKASQSANVIKSFQCKETRDSFYLIQEAANCGNLDEFVKKRGGFLSEAESTFII